jgi:hypothetical protein
MANIIGEPFLDYVSNQIKIRQTTQGSGVNSLRSSEDITVLNSQTAWVKLGSGVTVTPERLKSAQIPTSGWGDNLAKSFVLYGGTAKLEGNVLKQRTGLLGNNGIYNITNNKEEFDFGLVPMPGIESVDVQCLTRGSIKKATVKIKAYSRAQFDILDILYLRLGYTVLLEWGNSIYKDNNGTLQTMGYTFLEDSNGFFSDSIEKQSPLAILKTIEGWRKAKNGNYDALLARVVNFEWTFTQDGAYDITLSLISLGDIVESLKSNISPGKEEFKFINDILASLPQADPAVSPDPPEEQDAQRSNDPSPTSNKIAAHLFIQKLSFKQQNVTTPSDITFKINGSSFPIGEFVTPKAKVSYELEGDETSFNVENTGQSTKDVACFFYSNGEEDTPDVPRDLGFYIRFGYLLKYIRNFVIPKIDKGKGDKNPPIIDINCNTWSNKMYYFPGQLSIDPRVCVVNGELKDIDAFNQLVGWHSTSQQYAWPMNIYVSFSTILDSLNSNVDSEGNVNIQAFLSSICSALNIALGGINNLEAIVDENENTIKIIDSSYSSPKLQDQEIISYGYKGQESESTFVRNIDLKTTISPEFATMVTVGATAGGYVKGTEATMFSKWNKGIKDRFSPKLTPGDPASKEEGNSDDEANDNYVKEYYAKGKLALGYKYDGSSEIPQLDDAAIDNNVSIVTEYFKYAQAQLAKKYPDYSSPTQGFIPFSLGLTLDGIAGIKIYNAITVDSSFLPINYTKNSKVIRFIIKGVNHKLSGNDWETTLETMVITETQKSKGTPHISFDQIKSFSNNLLNNAGIGQVKLDDTKSNVNSSGQNESNPITNNAPSKGSGLNAEEVGGTGVKTFGTKFAATKEELSPDALTKDAIRQVVKDAGTDSIIRQRIVQAAASYAGNFEATPPKNPGWWDKEYERRFKELELYPWSKPQPWCAWFCQLVWKGAYSTGTSFLFPPDKDNRIDDNVRKFYKDTWEGVLRNGGTIGAGTSTCANNFKLLKKYVTAEQVRRNPSLLEPGDIAYYGGHVDLVIKPFITNGQWTGYSAIGGNTGKEDFKNGGETKYYKKQGNWKNAKGFCKVITPFNVNTDYSKK